jgi:hypothetical protein
VLWLDQERHVHASPAVLCDSGTTYGEEQASDVPKEHQCSQMHTLLKVDPVIPVKSGTIVLLIVWQVGRPTYEE